MNIEPNVTLYKAVVSEAASGGDILMGKLVTSARVALVTREAAERDLRVRQNLTQSIALLKAKEHELCKRFPRALADAFDNPLAKRGKAKLSLSAMDEVQFDQLELMDETHVQESIIFARAQQVTMQAAEANLAELNALLSTTLGMQSVRPDLNPLRPEVYFNALRETLDAVQAPTHTRVDWLAAMGVSLGTELALFYSKLVVRLKAEGVAPAGYAVVQTPQAGGARGVIKPISVNPGSGAFAPGAPAPSMAMQSAGGHPTRGAGGAYAMAPAIGGGPGLVPRRSLGADPTLLTLDKLRQLLSGELETQTKGSRVVQFAQQFAREFESGGAGQGAGAAGGGVSFPAIAQPDFASTVPAAFEALTEMKQADQVVQSLEQRRAGAAANPEDPGAQMRVFLRRSVSGVAQALSLEVVALMVDNIARDPRLLDPVRLVIRSLESPLLLLSLVDPRFFTDKQHPARQLLQEITHRSMAFESEMATGFKPFLTDLEEALTPLLTAEIDNAEPFERVLHALKESWSRAARQKEQSRAQAVEALKHAEARNLLAEKIAREVDGHPDAKRVPGAVIDFLCGPWAQVVAQARIKGGAGSAAADKYQALISALLWSAHPELARESIAKLTKLVPRLLATLREGLDSIQYPATKTSAFFEALMVIHQQAFRSPELAPSTEAAALSKAPPNVRTRWVDDGNPWVAPEEARDSNFVEIEEELSTPAADAAPMPQPVAIPAADVPTDELPLGSWVELLVNAQWARTQLTWASPHGTLFLFTSAFGTTQSMTRRTRDKLVQEGKLRVVSDQHVVDGALDAVAQEALRNSVDTTY